MSYFTQLLPSVWPARRDRHLTVHLEIGMPKQTPYLVWLGCPSGSAPKGALETSSPAIGLVSFVLAGPSRSASIGALGDQQQARASTTLDSNAAFARPVGRPRSGSCGAVGVRVYYELRRRRPVTV